MKTISSQLGYTNKKDNEAYEQGRKDKAKGLTLSRPYYTVSQKQAYKMGNK